jgi:hypothetical protein
MQQHRRDGGNSLQRPPAPSTRTQPPSIEDAARTGPVDTDRARTHTAAAGWPVPCRTTVPPPLQRAGITVPGERPRSGPRHRCKHRHPSLAPRPRPRDDHHWGQLRQGGGEFHHGVAARHQPEHPPPPPAAATSQTGPCRRPSTTRASPCSFLRGEGLREEGGRTGLGLRGIRPCRIDVQSSEQRPSEIGVRKELPRRSVCIHARINSLKLKH